MLGRTTRLEFIIVSMTFLALLLYSKPPRPGSAIMEGIVPQTSISTVPETPPASELTIVESPNQTLEVDLPEPSLVEDASPQESNSQAQSNLRQPTDPAPQVPRLASVDARHCDNLQYDQIMQGEVTVRWVWNGHELVPQKVCVVHEPNGVSRVWRFDEQGNAILSEIQPAPDPSR